jgi:hypothetical protein
VRNFALEYGLKLGGKIGKATGEHGEVVGAIMLLSLSGVMAEGWLLPGRERGYCEVEVSILVSSTSCTATAPRPQPAQRAAAEVLSGSLAPQLALARRDRGVLGSRSRRRPIS